MQFHAVEHAPQPLDFNPGPQAFTNRSAAGPVADAIEELDWMTGVVLDAIDVAGVRDSTLVIWTADNGPWTNEQQRAGSVGPFGAGWLRDNVSQNCTVCPDL
jgi:arylsulfatase A-like enzyme